jgi:YceI-like domain
MPLPLLLILLFLAGSKPLPAQVSGTYRVNTKESQIEIHLFKGGFLSSLGDNHLITMTHFSGMANLSKADSWRADLLGEAASLRVIDPWGNPSERKDVQDTMLGPQQIDAEHFPSIELHSLSFDPVDHDTVWNLVANVELHGVTRKEQFSLACHQIGSKLQIQGKKMFKLTDFNIQPFSTAFGAIKVRNDFEVTYNIVLDPIH